MSIKNSKYNFKQIIVGIVFIIFIIIIGYFNPNIQEIINNVIQEQTYYSLSDIPEYSGNPYVTINDNIPYFAPNDYTTDAFENYSKLDYIYGRCGVAYANICKEIMPSDNDERGDLTYEPTGWKQKIYKGIIDGGYLYNRCHLIGWQLAGENNNKFN